MRLDLNNGHFLAFWPDIFRKQDSLQSKGRAQTNGENANKGDRYLGIVNEQVRFRASGFILSCPSVVRT